MQSRKNPSNRLASWQILVGIVSASTAFCVLPARAACDASTTGVSVCTGTDAAIAKTATGNLDVQFNNETVTTCGVTISGGAGGVNVHPHVGSATGPEPVQDTGR